MYNSSPSSGDPGVKPLNLIVVTHGCPNEGPDPKGIIRNLASRLDRIDAPPHQLGIQFFQVGSDRHARRALRDLDDGLNGVRDMVDAVSFNRRSWLFGAKKLTVVGILKTLRGSVNRKLDRAKPKELYGWG